MPMTDEQWELWRAPFKRNRFLPLNEVLPVFDQLYTQEQIAKGSAYLNGAETWDVLDRACAIVYELIVQDERKTA